jgi:hypothetical protein
VPETSPSSRWLHRLVSRDDLQLMLANLGLIAVLLVMGSLLSRVNSGAVLAGWTLLWLPLLLLLYWRRRMARRAWLMVHLRHGSPWYARLRGGILMLLGQTLVSGVLALVLLISLARGIPPSTWIVLVLFVPVWARAWSGLGRYLRRHASAEFLPLTAARTLVRFSGAVLLLGLATWSLWQPLSDLGPMTLHEAVRHFAGRQEAQSPFLAHLLTFAAALDGARHWLAQHWFDGLPGMALQFLAWVVVLVREWLFIWPYLLLCEALSHVACGHDYRDEAQRSGT